MLVVYVDDIMIIGDDTKGLIAEVLVETLLDQGSLIPKYFLGNEIARSKKGFLLSQGKYVFDLLSEAGMLGYKSIDSSMNMNTKLQSDQGELLEGAGRYRRLVEKSNYLTVIRLNITLTVCVVSQFLSALRTTHL